MKNPQPNFEKVKAAFYQVFINGRYIENDIANFILLETVATGRLTSFHSNLSEFKKELNHWLDTVDIRMAARLIDVVAKKQGNIPSWIKRKQFVIDYNDSGALDLIRTHHENL